MNTADVLEQLKLMVQSGDKEKTAHQVQSMASGAAVEEEAKKMIIAIFQCSICLSSATLPAAVCSGCFAIIGCVPCIEQWHASSLSSKCPLCRTTKDYSLLPMVRDIARLLGQPILESQANDIDDSESDTIPYGNIEDIDDVNDDELMTPML